MSMAFFAEIDQSILVFIWKQRRSQIAKAVLSINNNVWRGLSNFLQLYCRAIVIKPSMVLTRKQTGRKFNRIDGPDIKPSSHRSLSFDKDDKKYTLE